MPLITQSFDPSKGPYIDVFLSKPESITFRKEEIDESMRRVTLLLDTGASKTVISEKIAKSMGLLPISKTTMKSATHEVEANIYYADLSCSFFAPPLKLQDLTITAFPFADGWIDGFLGRDFFEKVIFTLNGPENTFTLAA